MDHNPSRRASIGPGYLDDTSVSSSQPDPPHRFTEASYPTVDLTGFNNVILSSVARPLTPPDPDYPPPITKTGEDAHRLREISLQSTSETSLSTTSAHYTVKSVNSRKSRLVTFPLRRDRRSALHELADPHPCTLADDGSDAGSDCKTSSDSAGSQSFCIPLDVGLEMVYERVGDAIAVSLYPRHPDVFSNIFGAAFEPTIYDPRLEPAGHALFAAWSVIDMLSISGGDVEDCLSLFPLVLRCANILSCVYWAMVQAEAVNGETLDTSCDLLARTFKSVLPQNYPITRKRSIDLKKLEDVSKEDNSLLEDLVTSASRTLSLIQALDMFVIALRAERLLNVTPERDCELPNPFLDMNGAPYGKMATATESILPTPPPSSHSSPPVNRETPSELRTQLHDELDDDLVALRCLVLRNSGSARSQIESALPKRLMSYYAYLLIG
ncbi:hypothetical protein BC834DRAFT_891940 [Gloeopeniophorella convolvens]|nr:hypothetical protein BC834DRAFT_891940 [Gloeopeniophorella convolvens]